MKLELLSPLYHLTLGSAALHAFRSVAAARASFDCVVHNGWEHGWFIIIAATYFLIELIGEGTTFFLLFYSNVGQRTISHSACFRISSREFTIIVKHACGFVRLVLEPTRIVRPPNYDTIKTKQKNENRVTH